MKKIILILILIFFTKMQSFSQHDPGHEIGRAEIIIYDSAGFNGTIFVKVFPVGTVFSRYNNTQNLEYKYSLMKTRDDIPCHWPFYYSSTDTNQFIVGGSKIIEYNDYGLIDFDDGIYFHDTSTLNLKVIGGISYGL